MALRPTKRLRACGDDGEGSDNAPAQEDGMPSFLFRLLKWQRVPPKILALPHVTKLIEMMLMAPDEAITEAARTGQADWALELLGRYNNCDVSPAIHHAVSKGDVVIMKMLADKLVNGMAAKSKGKALHAFNEAAVAAAGLGHVHIVKLLVEIIYIPLQEFWTIGSALHTAAAKGQLQVVKFLLEYAEQTNHIGWLDGRVDTLALAIRGGNAEVIDLLLTHPRLRWNLEEAFDEAMKRDDKALVERIYQLYSVQFLGNDLFVHVAAAGNLEAVKYLHHNGHDDMESVSNAFQRAASGPDKTAKVVEFLLDTGRIAPRTFDKAFKKACARWDTLNNVMLLYNTKKASENGINRAFATAPMPALMKFLYEHEKISDEALIAAFKKTINRYLDDRFDCLGSLFKDNAQHILEFLSEQKCIPSEMICKALGVAVRAHATDLVECLCNDPRATPVAMTETFVMAAISGYADLVRILYNMQHVSPETLLKAFTEASHRGHLDATKQIMAFMTIEENVPREFKSKAFVIAARHGQMSVMKIVCESESGEWPLEVLKLALDAAKHSNHKIVKLIRELASDQELLKPPSEVKNWTSPPV